MAKVNPFKAIRPKDELANKVAALPYDVMNSDEAREMVKGNDISFLHVDKAEIDLSPDTYIYDDSVYAKAKENLDKLIKDGVLNQEEDSLYYIYNLTMNGKSQAGIVACASVDDYLENKIKKHEFTRADKEKDRIRHVDTLNANTGPIFLAHRPDEVLSAIAAKWMEQNEPIYDFVADGDVGHKVYRVTCPDATAKIKEAFEKVPALYIADGHHRCASAVKVAQMRREEFPDYNGDEEFNQFLAVIFPSDQLHIMDYNRLLKDTNGHDEKSFLEEIGKHFEIIHERNQVRPKERHEFGMYAFGKWYRLKANADNINENDPVERLDVSILQKLILAPVFGIDDPRTDSRIDFAGGIRGIDYLEQRAQSDMKVAFVMHPTTMDELMDIADAGEVMPPKSTWFEPKLLSGLFIHEL